MGMGCTLQKQVIGKQKVVITMQMIDPNMEKIELFLCKVLADPSIVIVYRL